MGEITAILTGYNRPMNMGALHCAVAGQSVKPADIWVWYNQGKEEQIDLYGAKGAYLDWNAGFYGRFAYALLAKTEYVAIFDDDTVPGEKWFENCLETIKEFNGILGTIGILHLNDSDYDRGMSFGWRNPNEDTIPVDLVGHAWFFRREWLNYFWEDMPYTFENAEDIHFSAMAFKHGINTYVPPHPMKSTETWGSVHGMELGSDSVATWKTCAKHIMLRSAAMRHYISKGYVPVYRRDLKT